MKENTLLQAFKNAFLAEAYIVGVVLLINRIATTMQPIEESLLIPITMLSLFVLSAAVMGYLFLAEPIQRYLDGEKKQAVHLFLSTVGIFALITAIVFAILLSGVLS